MGKKTAVAPVNIEISEEAKPSGLNFIVAATFIVGDLAGGGMMALPNALVQTVCFQTCPSKFDLLNFIVAATFIVGDLAGGGMMALPNALVQTGLWPGVILLFVCSILTTYTGWQLGKCWNLMRDKWPEKYKEKACRKPYGEIAYRACGPRIRSVAAVVLCLTQFGFAIVILLLASKNLSILLHYFFTIKISFCYLIILVGLIVWPITMLKSPMHFWYVALFSAASSSIAVILLLIGMSHDAPVCTQDVPHNSFHMQKFLMAFGTMLFAFGGHSAFPTIQHDMKQPKHFSYSLYLSFTLVIIYYFSVSLTGYFVYGSSVGDAIIPSIQLIWVQQLVNIMIAVHVITTIVIVFSPLTQQIEDFLSISHKFGWQRFIVRTVLFWLIVFGALSVPNFGPMMDLIGASTMCAMTVVMPPVFYIYLKASIKKQEVENIPKAFATWTDVTRYVNKPTLYFNVFCISFGVLGGLIASIASIIKLTSSEVAAPCYIQYFQKGGLPFSDASAGSINCCGSFHNLTVSGMDPLDFCTTTVF